MTDPAIDPAHTSRFRRGPVCVLNPVGPRPSTKSEFGARPGRRVQAIEAEPAKHDEEDGRPLEALPMSQGQPPHPGGVRGLRSRDQPSALSSSHLHDPDYEIGALDAVVHARRLEVRPVEAIALWPEVDQLHCEDSRLLVA